MMPEDFENMSLDELLRKDCFTSNVGWTSKPTKPRLKTNSPTDEQIIEYQAASAEYGELYRAWESRNEIRAEDQKRLDNLFQEKMAEELGYDPKDNFSKLLITHASESCDYESKAAICDNMALLMPLYRAYKKVCEERDALKN